VGGWGEGFFSFFFGSQCVPQHNITMCSFSLPLIKTPRTPPPPPPHLYKKNKNHDQMLHRERAVTERIFQALPNFCPHRQTDRHVQEGTLNTKTTPCSHGFKIYRPRQTDRLTKLIYKMCSLHSYKNWFKVKFFYKNYLY